MEPPCISRRFQVKFAGTFAGVETAVAIPSFAGLTANVESFQATITHSFPDGVVTIWTAPFTESGPDTATFRAPTGEASTSRAQGFTDTVIHQLIVLRNFDAQLPDTVVYFTGQSRPADGGLELAETGNDTKVFRRTLDDGSSVEIGITSFDGLTDAVDSAVFVLKVTIPGQPALAFRMTATETGPETNTFAYTVDGSKPVMLCPTIGGVANIVVPKPPGAVPIALRVRGLPAGDVLQNWAVHLSGSGTTFRLKMHTDGSAYAARNEVITTGFAVTCTELYSFLYWDAGTQAVTRQPLGQSLQDWQACALRQGATVARSDLNGVEIDFVDKQGNAMESADIVPVHMLLAKLDGEDIGIDEDTSFWQLRLHGCTASTTVRVSSDEIETEFFDLIAPCGVSAAQRRAALLTQAGKGEAETLACLYSADEETSTLSDEQWEALKQLGLLAVHNAGAGARGGNAFARIWGYVDHHIFNKFDGNPELARFWTDVFGHDFKVDDYCVRIRITRH